ncbi:MAG TPA: serine--tRNA ligase [Clostridiales bacterium]|nr:serine--tRNA ligase [Clostridiales bacterium]
MLDINLIRKEPEKVRQALLKRMDHVSFDELLDWDREYRAILTQAETLKAQRNTVSAMIPRLKKQGEDVTDKLEEMKVIADRIKELDATSAQLSEKIKDFMDGLPNMPADDVIAGDKEQNVVVRTYGEKPQFDFQPKDHVELVESLNLVDYQRGVKIGGSGFWLYKGKGALLEWALINFFISEHIRDGYEFILPPHILNEECGYTAGQFPKFKDDVFTLDNPDGKMQFILPTAETALASYHRNEVLKEEELPKKYFAYTPCYRKEAGSYRTEERGMIRGHQFNKVEMFQYTRPEDSEKALEELVGKAESLVQKLGLHYRLSKLAAKDVSASMGKTFDIEVWIPSMNQYKEISSASNAYDYQARRGNMRFKRTETKKNELLHTLNASGLATSRLLPAIMEQHQQKDGSVIVPEVLRAMVGTDLLKP